MIQHPVAAPPPDVPHDGMKDAERLKQLMQLNQRIELAWLDPLTQKLALLSATPAKKLGFGPWRKKHVDQAALEAALDQHIRPVFEKLWGVPLDSAPDLPGEPPLHSAYLEDEDAYRLEVQQDDTKHVAHAYAMVLAHRYFRLAVAESREEKPDRMPEDLLHLLEVNFCQYYVPRALTAYFEAQPLRVLMRDVANRFRKVAFGGQ